MTSRRSSLVYTRLASMLLALLVVFASTLSATSYARADVPDAEEPAGVDSQSADSRSVGPLILDDLLEPLKPVLAFRGVLA